MKHNLTNSIFTRTFTAPKMIEPNEIFSKVPNENKTSTYRIKTEWEEGYFRLCIFEGTNSWFALVTKEHINMLAEQRELEPTIYFNNLREYICCDQSSVSFSIVKKQFIIFRSIEKEKLRIRYFFVNLEKLNYQETIESVVDDLTSKCTEMQAKVRRLEEQKLEAESQKMLYQRKCEEYVELKRKADLHMYDAFAKCLNAKKHRIRFLTELLEEYQTGRLEKRNPVTATSSKANKETKNKPLPILPTSSTTVRPKETISDSESNESNPSDDYNTDVEKDNKDDEQVPSTSTDLDFLGDSPPPPSLPKRIRIVRNKASQENTSVKLNEKTKVNELKQEAMDVKEASSEDDDDAGNNYNTQDLLDRM